MNPPSRIKIGGQEWAVRDEEAMCRFLASWLLAVFRDNPKLISFLTER